MLAVLCDRQLDCRDESREWLQEGKRVCIIHIPAYLRDITGSVPDHHNKARIVIKGTVIFLQVGGLAFSLLKTTPVKPNK